MDKHLSAFLALTLTFGIAQAQTDASSTAQPDRDAVAPQDSVGTSGTSPTKNSIAEGEERSSLSHAVNSAPGSFRSPAVTDVHRNPDGLSGSSAVTFGSSDSGTAEGSRNGTDARRAGGEKRPAQSQQK